jgi:hypothetical protein
LLIRVRLTHQPGLPPPAAGWDQRVPAALADAAGTHYRQLDARFADAAIQQEEAGPIVRETVLAFERPPSSRGPLHLELPAAAWGGTGTLKFAIPPALVRR